VLGLEEFQVHAAVFVNAPRTVLRNDGGDIQQFVAIEINVAEEVDIDLAGCLVNGPGVSFAGGYSG